MVTTEDKHFQRLTEVVDWSYRQQKPDLEIHKTLIQYLTGEYYPTRLGESGPQTSIPLLSLAGRAMSRHLVSKAPRVIVNIADPRKKSWAENEELSANQRISRMKTVATLREVVDQSMVSFGTLFFAPMYVGTEGGMKLDLGAEAIDRCDFGYDVESSTLEGADIQFHKLRMKIVDIREHPRFDRDARMEVESSGVSDSPRDEQSNFRRAFGRRESLYDYAEIFCVYDQPRNKIVYYPRHQPSLRLLEFDWQGPRQGPYRFLYYEKPPGNAVPIAPLVHLLTKHKAFNVLDMKTIHQQQVAKGLLFYTNASKEEAERIVNAIENQSVLQENGAARYGHIGGAAQDTVAMAEKQKRDFSYASNGIIDQFQQQADTLGQERLLRGASNEMLDDMSGWAQVFMKGFCQDVVHFNIRDPDPRSVMLRKPIEGTDLSYPVEWTAEHRRMSMEMEYDVDVMPYSYVNKTPQSALADLLGALQIIQGMGDQAAAQGITIDVEAVMRTIAKYKNLPELYDCLILNQDPDRLQQLLGARQGGQPTDPSKPNGRYTRQSTSDGSGENMELMRLFNKSSSNEGIRAIA